MIVYPNAKINLGLNVTQKRSDGFHELETVFYPIPLYDILEILPSQENTFSQSGLKLDTKNNIVVKAYELLSNRYSLPTVKIHLHKMIPFGAGLGGGSADAAFFIKAMNDLFSLKISKTELKVIAEEAGSDCPFFIENIPSVALGKGEKLYPLDEFSLRDYFIVLVKPSVIVSTVEAYKGIKPIIPEDNIVDVLQSPFSVWREKLKNDFEQSIFENHDELKRIKEELYDIGALYAAMSGSGSSIFGIFKNQPTFNHQQFPKKSFITVMKLH